MPQLTFYGAAETVTGSKYLLEAAPGRVLIDCGLFQGLKELRLKNWEPLPFKPASVQAIVLTHA
ncbi:MAG TPA: MBL fold metallo-hydrolase, partial [Pirellulales bacterium]